MICQKKGCEAAILSGIMCANHQLEFVKYYSATLDKEKNEIITRLQVKIHALEADLKREKHKSMMLTNKCKRYRQGRTQ